MRLTKLIAILGFALLTTLALPAQTVRVIFTSGSASIQRPDEAAPRAIIKGESVIIGTRIITGADGRVVLTPMPGVKSIVAPNTTLTLESSSETKTSETNVTHQAVINLKEGAVVSDLQKPEGVTYDYSIRTARGLAGARGTTFTVGINPAGIQTIVVAHGTISLSFTDGRQVSVAIGQLSITPPGGESKTVGNVSELTPSEKAIAQNWVETTVGAIASAIEAGVEVDIEALQNALAAAESLGIKLPPDLQALVDRLLALLAMPPATDSETDTEVITELLGDPTEERTALESFRSELSPVLQAALDDIIADGGFTPQQIEALLADPDFRANLIPTLNLYATLDGDTRGLLQALGIVGSGNIAAVGADPDGIVNLISAYADLGAPVISQTTPLNEADYTGAGPFALEGSSFFFPGTSGHSGTTLMNVEFKSTGTALYIGATRVLSVKNLSLPTNPTFDTAPGGHLELRASDLVDLEYTKFGTHISSILIEAATINLKNITFQDGSFVTLRSKDGVANFGPSVYGKVNFISGVNYGNTAITDQTVLNGITNIQIQALSSSSVPN